MEAKQIILIVALLILAVMTWVMVRRQLAVRLFFLAQFLVGIAFVVWPDFSTWVAQHLGIGRGTDLVLYLLVLFVFCGAVCVLGKFRQIERQQTKMIRRIALLEEQVKAKEK